MQVCVNGSYPSDFAPDFSQNPHKSIPCHYVGPSVCEGERRKRNRDFNAMGTSVPSVQGRCGVQPGDRCLLMFGG